MSGSGPVFSQRITSRYARALFQSASDKAARKTYDKHIETLQQALSENTNLATFFHSPLVDREAKTQVLTQLGERLSLDSVVVSFLKVLVMNKRFEGLSQILQDYQALLREEENRQEVIVKSATPLTPTQVKDLTKVLETHFQSKIDLKTEEAPELIGGFQIHTQGQLIDGSLIGTLQSLARNLEGTSQL